MIGFGNPRLILGLGDDLKETASRETADVLMTIYRKWKDSKTGDSIHTYNGVRVVRERHNDHTDHSDGSHCVSGACAGHADYSSHTDNNSTYDSSFNTEEEVQSVVSRQGYGTVVSGAS